MNSQLLELKKILSNKNWQKFCTAEDWALHDFKYVQQEIFGNNASYHRKQWEFVVIFLSLMQQNKLHSESVGASFGAGKEPLIYVLLPFVKSFLATDLYSWTTGWNTARMGEKDTPQDFLKRHAPDDLDIDNLKAVEMDMRYLDIEDNSLDFCYSSCAFEHIGHRDDFIKHLLEVKRVLKDDGVYVVTTELLFDRKTIANKGNYKFDLSYLQKMFNEVGLDPLPEFDGTCDHSRLNFPKAFVRPLLGGNGFDKLLANGSILDIEGVPYTSCNFVLSKSNSQQSQSFVTHGFEQSVDFINVRKHRNMINLYSSKKLLDPFFSLKKPSRLYLDDHMSFRIQPNEKRPAISLLQPNFCYTDFIWFDEKQVEFCLTFEFGSYEGKVNWYLVEKEQMKNQKRKKIEKQIISYNLNSGVQRLIFSFQAETGKTYAVIGEIHKGMFSKELLKMSIDHLTIEAQLV